MLNESVVDALNKGFVVSFSKLVGAILGASIECAVHVCDISKLLVPNSEFLVLVKCDLGSFHPVNA